MKKKGNLVQWNIFSLKNEENIAIYDKMDGPGNYYIKWKKPLMEGQILHGFTYLR